MNLLKDMKASEPLNEGAPALQRAVDTLDQCFVELVGGFAQATGITLQGANDALAAEFIARLRQRTPGHVLDADGRAARWRVRVRLYEPGRKDEPAADSDPDLPADKPGTAIIAGLPGVGHHLAELAAQFHQGPCLGLDEATLRHRIKSLRPTLSRRGGDATWRVPYRTREGGSEWLARVDVERAET